MINPIIAVFFMAFVTYLTRALPILLLKKQITSKRILAFLNYVPFAVLASMTFPEIFYSTNTSISAITGTIIALVLSYFEKSLVVVAIGGIITVFLTELIIF